MLSAPQIALTIYYKGLLREGLYDDEILELIERNKISKPHEIVIRPMISEMAAALTNRTASAHDILQAVLPQPNEDAIYQILPNLRTRFATAEQAHEAQHTRDQKNLYNIQEIYAEARKALNPSACALMSESETADLCELAQRVDSSGIFKMATRP